MSPTPNPNDRFLDLAPALAADPTAPYAVLPLPYERTVCYGSGAAAGPSAIVHASLQVEGFDEELREPLGLRVQTLPALRFDGLDDAAALRRIREAAEPVLRAGRFLLALGGEHTVTAPLVEAAVAARGPLGVLQIDAHADLRTDYSGTPLSHACVMRRIREQGVPTVGVGIRNLSEPEYDYIRTEAIPVFWAGDLAGRTDTAWIDAVVAALPEQVYVTIDIDGLDPSIAPGTGTPDPGGLTWKQATSLLRAVCGARRVVAADIVEVAPIAGTQATEYAAARLATKLMLYHRNGKASNG